MKVNQDKENYYTSSSITPACVLTIKKKHLNIGVSKFMNLCEEKTMEPYILNTTAESDLIMHTPISLSQHNAGSHTFQQSVDLSLLSAW